MLYGIKAIPVHILLVSVLLDWAHHHHVLVGLFLSVRVVHCRLEVSIDRVIGVVVCHKAALIILKSNVVLKIRVYVSEKGVLVGR